MQENLGRVAQKEWELSRKMSKECFLLDIIRVFLKLKKPLVI